MWLQGSERTLQHFIKHGSLRLKCINVIARSNCIVKCSEDAQNYILRLGTIFMKFASGILSDLLDHGSWHQESCGSCTSNIYLVVRSCRSWIFKVRSVLRSWGSWILQILDPKSWILTFDFVVGYRGSWILISSCGTCLPNTARLAAYGYFYVTASPEPTSLISDPSKVWPDLSLDTTPDPCHTFCTPGLCDGHKG